MFWSPVGAAEPPELAGFGRTQDRPGTATRQNLPDLPDLPDPRDLPDLPDPRDFGDLPDPPDLPDLSDPRDFGDLPDPPDLLDPTGPIGAEFPTGVISPHQVFHQVMLVTHQHAHCQIDRCSVLFFPVSPVAARPAAS